MRRIALTLGVVTALTAGGLAAGPTPVGFGTETVLPVPDLPMSLTVADVTGDGANDVIVAPNRAPSVRVYPGHGDGTFGAAVDVSTGAAMYTRNVRAARLNGDAAFDVVADHQGSASLSLLLSDGAGGFTLTDLAAPDALQGESESFALADWDGDTDVDVVTITTAGRTRVRLNDGTGAFADPVTVLTESVGSAGSGLVVADLDNDGQMDVAKLVGNGARVYWRDGASLVAGPVLAFDRVGLNGASNLVAADVDGDGRPDLGAVVSTYPGLYEVFRHTGARTFAAAEASPLHDGLQTMGPVAAADLNGDGFPEIVLGSQILVNRGDGRFGPPLDLSAGSGWASAVGYLDTDPRPDVVVADHFGSAGAVVFPVRTSLSAPAVGAVAPSTLYAGTSRTVTITGTGFDAGDDLVDFGDDISVDAVRVVSDTEIEADVTMAPGVVPGARSVSVVLPDGAVATAQVTVSGGGTASLTSVTPGSAHAGDTVTAAIDASGLVDGATLDFGAGVAVDSVVQTGGRLTATITIAGDAAAGPRDVTIVNGSGLESVAAGAFTVLPRRSLDLTAERGRLKPAVPGRGTLVVSGSVAFNAYSPDGTFSPATEGVELRLGDPASPTVVTIPADGGWRIRGSRNLWHTGRGVRPRTDVVLDLRRQRFRIRLTHADFAAPGGGDVLVEMTLGTETGTSVREWRPARRGTFVLK